MRETCLPPSNQKPPPPHRGTVMRLMTSEPFHEEPRPLTPREIECLQWTLHGKTAWEVASILDIAEPTAARHLHNASRKLGCTSKHQATLKALLLGLIAQDAR